MHVLCHLKTRRLIHVGTTGQADEVHWSAATGSVYHERARASPLPPSGFSSYSSSLKAVPAYQWWPCYAPRMVARIEFVSRGPDAIEASAAWVLKPRD
jgi:hypothetical protein